MRHLIITLTLILLTACSMSGFKPPTSNYYWTLPGLKDMNFKGLEAHYKRKKDMTECGIDPFVGDSTVTSKRICMQEKGWVYKKIED